MERLKRKREMIRKSVTSFPAKITQEVTENPGNKDTLYDLLEELKRKEKFLVELDMQIEEKIDDESLGDEVSKCEEYRERMNVLAARLNRQITVLEEGSPSVGPVVRYEGNSELASRVYMSTMEHNARDQSATHLLAQHSTSKVSTVVKIEGDFKGGAIGDPAFYGNITNLNYGCHSQSVEGSLGQSSSRENLELVREDWTSLQDFYMEEDSWLKPFPWSKEKFAQELFYIPLVLDVYMRGGENILHEKPDELEHLFDPLLETGERSRKVLVRGNGGFGKTTLCSKVAFEWAQRVTSIAAFPAKSTLFVHYKLRQLRPEERLPEVLFNFVHSHYAPKTISESLTRDTLWDLGTNLVVMLDGYDETHQKGQEEVKQLIKGKERSPFSRASFLVTSRPTDDLDFLLIFEKQFFISKMSFQWAMKLISTFCKHNDVDMKHVSKYLYQLDLTVLSPLTIFALCWLRTQEPNTSFTDSNEIMLKCVKLLAKRCNLREGFGLSDEKINSILLRLGQMCTLSSDLLTSEANLKAIFEGDYLLVWNMGIWKNSGNEFYEITQKLFYDSLTTHYIQYVLSSFTKTMHPSADNVERFFGNSICPLGVRSKKINIYLKKDDVQYDVVFDVYVKFREGLIKFSASLGKMVFTFKEKIANSKEFYPCVLCVESFHHAHISRIAQSVTKKLGNVDFGNLLRDYFSLEDYRFPEEDENSALLYIHFDSDQDLRISKIQNTIVDDLNKLSQQQIVESPEKTRIDIAMKSSDKNASHNFQDRIKDVFGLTEKSFRRDLSLADHLSYADCKTQAPKDYYETWRYTVDGSAPLDFLKLHLTIFHVKWNFVKNTDLPCSTNVIPEIFMAQTSFETPHGYHLWSMSRFLENSILFNNEWDLLSRRYKECYPTQKQTANGDGDDLKFENNDIAFHTYFEQKIEGKRNKSIQAGRQVIFDPVVEGEHRAETVLITGEVGSGKTHLCQFVSYWWSSYFSMIWALPARDCLPLFIQLRTLPEMSDLETFLFQFIHEYYSPKGEKNEAKTYKIIRKLGKDLVILLDGYDEVGEDIQKQVKKILRDRRNTSIDGSLFHLASFLITSRPSADPELPLLFDKHLVIKNVSGREEWLRSLSRVPYLDKFNSTYREIAEQNLTPLFHRMIHWFNMQEDTQHLTERNDIIMQCIRHLAKRCNAIEKHALSQADIDLILERLGQICALREEQPEGYFDFLEYFSDDQFTFVKRMGILQPIPTNYSVIQCKLIHEMFYTPLAHFRRDM